MIFKPLLCSFLFILAFTAVRSLSGIYAQDINSRIGESDKQIIPDFSWLNQTDEKRPKYVWENREDVIYHDRYYPDSSKMTAPEIYPIMRGIWVFNRNMIWIRNDDRTIIAYENPGHAILTGKHQVSAWYSDPINKIADEDSFTVFEKRSTIRRRDCAVLPSFQFHKGQHRILELTVSEVSDDWQFVISIKGRSGPPLLSSDWQSGSKKLLFDIGSALENKGYEWNYPELHFVIGTWAKSAESGSRIKFHAKLLDQPAVVGCLPVIRKIDDAGRIPVTAMYTGNIVDTLKLSASVNGHEFKMTKAGDVWKAELDNLSPGSYKVWLRSNVKGDEGSTILVRITDGEYWKHDNQYNTLETKSYDHGALTGSFQGTFFFKDVGLASEQLVNSQREWDQWNRLDAPGEHLHFWESLTRSELRMRFSYLSMNGWDILHLHSHYGIWERFDASGNLAPHGIEQLAIYIDEASRHNLNVQVTLSSYPYGYAGNRDWRDGTSPYLQTREKGFKNEDWFHPENEPFRSVYQQYLKDFVNTFLDETKLFSYSSSGEGDADYIGGVRRFQDTKDVIKSIDTNHLIVSEPIHNFPAITTLPQTIVKSYTSDIVGVRNYFQGDMFNPEVEMSVCLRLMKPVTNTYIAEGSFPASNLYTRFATNADCWVGTDFYRYNVRDWLYLGLVNRMPLIVTWDEAFAEDEHRVLNEVKKLVNWKQLPQKPCVSVVVEEAKISDTKFKLGKYEEIFSRLSIDYQFVSTPHEASKNDWVIDASLPFDSARFSRLSAIPAFVKKTIPFAIGPDYATSYTIMEDRKTIVAYIYNKTNYVKHRFYLTGINNRMPVKGTFQLKCQNIANGLNFRLYDLDKKEIVKKGWISEQMKLYIADTKADYVLVIYP